MANNPKLKTDVIADTSQFTKGMKQAQQDAKAFNKVTSGALGSVAGAFGINTDKISQMGGAFRSLGRSMSASSSGMVAGIGKMTTAMAGFGAAVGGVAIAALAAGVKMLKEDVEAFYGTLQGEGMKASMDAWKGTFAQTLRDMNEEAVSGIAKIGQSIQKGWNKFTGYIKMRAYGNNHEEALTGLDIADANANKASELAKQRVSAQQGLNAEYKKLADIEADIAKYRLIAWDKSNDATTRSEALAKVEELINERYNLRAGYLETIYNTTKGINDLASSGTKDIQAEASAYSAMMAEEQKRDNAKRELLEKQTEITKQAATERAEQEKLLQLEKQRNELKSLNLGISSETTSNLTNAINSQLDKDLSSKGGLQIPLAVDPAPAIEGIMDFASTASSAIENVATILGNLMGDLVTGNDEAWSNFGNDLTAMLADMATQIGKIAIGIGVAMIAIKKSLSNPFTAIAAGAALVALGAAVKAGLSNALSGNASGASASAVASSGYSSNSSQDLDYRASEINVKVTGRLQANGSTLVAVLDNEAKRIDHTT